MLHHLAADVERQILGVNDPLHEAQVRRQQALAVVGDEHPFDVELHVPRAVRMEQVERPHGRDEQQVGVADHALDPVVQGHPGIVEGMGRMMVEFRVLLVRHVLLVAGPDRRRRVQGLFRCLLAVAGQDDGNADMVRIGPHDVFDAGGLQIFLFVFLQMHDDVGAAGIARRILDGEFTAPVGRPFDGRVGAGLAGHDLDQIGDHEGGIEADAELADQRYRLILVFLAVAGKSFDESLRARPRDGAQDAGQFVLVHADAVVGDGQRLGFLIQRKRDAKAGIALDQLGFGQGPVAQLVTGVGRV